MVYKKNIIKEMIYILTYIKVMLYCLAYFRFPSISLWDLVKREEQDKWSKSLDLLSNVYFKVLVKRHTFSFENLFHCLFFCATWD